MKINWGIKIALFYSTFVLFIIFMVYMASQQKYDLVTEDYYAQEINYQGTINSTARAEKLESSIVTSIEKNELKVEFPQKETAISGNIQCFRPSDEAKDFKIGFQTELGFHKIPLNKFTRGKYLLKITWLAEGVSFYKEQTVIIP